MPDLTDFIAWTGASSILSAAHRSREGHLHGHTWRVTAWWKEGDCAVSRQKQLSDFLTVFDHTVLGDDYAWGEALGKAIAVALDCERVEVSRPLEGIFALVQRR